MRALSVSPLKHRTMAVMVTILLVSIVTLALLLAGGALRQVSRAQSATPDVADLFGGPDPVAASAAAAADHPNIEVVGHIGGSAYAVFVAGNYAYVGFGPELAVVDVTDPVHPRHRPDYTGGLDR